MAPEAGLEPVTRRLTAACWVVDWPKPGRRPGMKLSEPRTKKGAELKRRFDSDDDALPARAEEIETRLASSRGRCQAAVEALAKEVTTIDQAYCWPPAFVIQVHLRAGAAQNRLQFGDSFEAPAVSGSPADFAKRVQISNTFGHVGVLFERVEQLCASSGPNLKICNRSWKLRTGQVFD